MNYDLMTFLSELEDFLQSKLKIATADEHARQAIVDLLADISDYYNKINTK